MKLPKAKDILTKSGFKKISPEATIVSVFSKLRSSHDAVFVFEERKFLGLVNLYYSLIKKRLPAQAKVANCLYHPPRLDLGTPIGEIARLMVESRVYWLPVFDSKENFLGVVSARRLLGWLARQPLVNSQVIDLIAPQKPLFISSKEGIGKARHLMMSEKVSRLLVLNKRKKLAGLVTSYDLRQSFSSPVEAIRWLSRSPIKKEIVDIPVEKFVQKNIISVLTNEPLRKVIDQILKQGIGSVVVFPVGQVEPALIASNSLGFVSIRDLLKLVWKNYGQGQSVSLKMKLEPTLKAEERRVILEKVTEMIRHQPFLVHRIKDIRLVFVWLARKSRQPLFKIKASIITNKGQTLRVKAQGRKIPLVLNQLTTRLKQRLRKH